MAPLKRHPALMPLSRDHHQGLLFCWKIRQGFANNISVERVVDYARWFYENHLENHFRLEETYVFPLIDETHPLRRKAMSQHRRLRLLFKKLSQGNKPRQIVLGLIEEALEKHIRMEERALFPEIQQSAGNEQLIKMESIIDKAHQTAPDDWHDPFWLRPNKN